MYFLDNIVKIFFFNILDSKDINYAFIFGDFNKLRTINELYGHEYGTKIMQIALNLIKKIYPQKLYNV